MAIDPRKSVVGSWTPIQMSSTLPAGLPTLISTGITFIYFFLKACHYVFDAISHQTEGRVAMAMSGCGQQEHSADTGKEGHTEVCQTNTGKSFRTIWQRDPKILRVHFSTKKGARHMPPFPWGCSRTYRRAHFLRKCKRIAKQKASNFRRT